MESIVQQQIRAKRIQCHFFTRIRISHSSSWDIVKIKNMSSSGVFFNYPKKIPINTILEFKIMVPFADEIHCNGKVCRIEEKPLSITGMNKTFVNGIGAEFIQMDKITIKLIENFAEQFKN